MGNNARKSVFRVSNKVRFKPACSATETRLKIKMSLVTSLVMKHSNKQTPKTGFLASRPICSKIYSSSILCKREAKTGVTDGMNMLI